MAYYHTQVRVSGYGGWFLLRLSLHDPVLPLNIEVPLFPSSLNPYVAIWVHVMCEYYRHQVTMMLLNWGLPFLLLWVIFQHWMWRHWTNLCSSKHRTLASFCELRMNMVYMHGTSIIQKCTCLHRQSDIKVWEGQGWFQCWAFLSKMNFTCLYQLTESEYACIHWWGWCLLENKIWVTRIFS